MPGCLFPTLLRKTTSLFLSLWFLLLAAAAASSLNNEWFIKIVDYNICIGDFILNSWFNTDGSNLFDYLRKPVLVSESFVGSPLETIPSLRTLVVILTVSMGIWIVLHVEIVFLWTSDQFSTYLLWGIYLQWVRVILIWDFPPLVPRVSLTPWLASSFGTVN